jgi:hypothetical protein
MSLQTRLTSLSEILGTDVKALRARATALETSVGTVANLSTTNKTSLVNATNELNTKIGNLPSLTTTATSNVVAAINELKTNIGQLEQGTSTLVDDAAPISATDKTWSANKINTTIDNAVTALVGGAPAALDTLKELADALGSDALSTTITTALGLRVRVDEAQSFDTTQMTTGRTNIGAAAESVVSQLVTNLGDLDHNFVADYEAVRDAP